MASPALEKIVGHFDDLLERRKKEKEQARALRSVQRKLSHTARAAGMEDFPERVQTMYTSFIEQYVHPKYNGERGIVSTDYLGLWLLTGVRPRFSQESIDRYFSILCGEKFEDRGMDEGWAEELREFIGSPSPQMIERSYREYAENIENYGTDEALSHICEILTFSGEAPPSEVLQKLTLKILEEGSLELHGELSNINNIQRPATKVVLPEIPPENYKTCVLKLLEETAQKPQPSDAYRKAAKTLQASRIELDRWVQQHYQKLIEQKDYFRLLFAIKELEIKAELSLEQRAAIAQETIIPMLTDARVISPKRAARELGITVEELFESRIHNYSPFFSELKKELELEYHLSETHRKMALRRFEGDVIYLEHNLENQKKEVNKNDDEEKTRFVNWKLYEIKELESHLETTGVELPELLHRKLAAVKAEWLKYGVKLYPNLFPEAYKPTAEVSLEKEAQQLSYAAMYAVSGDFTRLIPSLQEVPEIIKMSIIYEPLLQRIKKGEWLERVIGGTSEFERPFKEQLGIYTSEVQKEIKRLGLL